MSGTISLPPLERALRLTLPYQRGNDVRALQTRMIERTDQPELAAMLRVADGLFGPATGKAVTAFQIRNQQRAGLAVDGVVGPMTWGALFSPVGADPSVLRAAQEAADAAAQPAGILDAALPGLVKPHRRFAGGVAWALTGAGVSVEGAAPEIAGRATVTDAMDAYGDLFRQVAAEDGVPVELLVATACTESIGGSGAEAARTARRLEPGFVSVAATPNKISIGLMQTLVSTAREVMKDRTLPAERLNDPLVSLRAGSGYIRRQGGLTRFDPPCVACAYNAGGIYVQDGRDNRWKMRQYPIGTGSHADRFVRFVNACFALFAQDPARIGKAPSLFALLN